MTRQRVQPFGHRRSLFVAVAAWLVSMNWPVTVAQAVSDADIPGVPLPGRVVTGTLGGPVYEHVYAIDVQPNTVILLSLRGDPGTDFDLYLFDAGATTVYSTQGQIAFSTSSTSTESIAYGTRSGGRFYIDLSGASDVEGTFRLTVALERDRTPPNMDLILDGGVPATPDPAVLVRLVATDDLSGVELMQFSPDGTFWHPWRAYAPTVLWTFPSGDGVKRLWARGRDASGNVSAVAEAQIILDTVRPVVASTNPGPNAEIASLTPTFRVTFSEAIDERSWSDLGLLVQDPEGTTIPGTYLWDSVTATGTFQPSIPMAAGVGHVVTLGQIRDPAGNALESLGSWVVTPLLAHSISLSASPRALVPRGLVTLSGAIDSVPTRSLVMEERSSDGSWQQIAGFVADGAGRFSLTVPVTRSTAFRVHLDRTATEAETFSPVVSVSARRMVSLPGVSSAVTRSSPTGRAISLRASIDPPAPAAIVSATIYKYNTSRRAYIAIGALNRTSVNGIAALTWRPTSPGSYYLRLTTPATPDLASGVSLAYRWVIR